MTSIRPVPYAGIMGIQIFPSEAGRVLFRGPARFLLTTTETATTLCGP